MYTFETIFGNSLFSQIETHSYLPFLNSHTDSNVSIHDMTTQLCTVCTVPTAQGQSSCTALARHGLVYGPPPILILIPSIFLLQRIKKLYQEKLEGLAKFNICKLSHLSKDKSLTDKQFNQSPYGFLNLPSLINYYPIRDLSTYYL